MVKPFSLTLDNRILPLVISQDPALPNFLTARFGDKTFFSSSDPIKQELARNVLLLQCDAGDEEWGFFELVTKTQKNGLHFAAPLSPLFATKEAAWKSPQDQLLLSKLEKSFNAKPLILLLHRFLPQVQAALKNIKLSQVEAFSLEGALKAFEHEAGSFYLKNEGQEKTQKQELLDRLDHLRQLKSFVEPLERIATTILPILGRHPDLVPLQESAALLHELLVMETDLESGAPFLKRVLLLCALAAQFDLTLHVASVRGFERAPFVLSLALAFRELVALHGGNFGVEFALRLPKSSFEEFSEIVWRNLEEIVAKFVEHFPRRGGELIVPALFRELFPGRDCTSFVQMLAVQ